MAEKESYEAAKSHDMFGSHSGKARLDREKTHNSSVELDYCGPRSWTLSDTRSKTQGERFSATLSATLLLVFSISKVVGNLFSLSRD